MPQNFLQAFGMFHNIGAQARDRRERKKEEEGISNVLSDMYRLSSQETTPNPETGELPKKRTMAEYANELIVGGADPKYVRKALGQLSGLYGQQSKDYANRYGEEFWKQTMGTPILSEADAARLNQKFSVGSGQGYNPQYTTGQVPKNKVIKYNQGSNEITGVYNENQAADTEGGILQPTTLGTRNTFSEEQGEAKTELLRQGARKAGAEADAYDNAISGAGNTAGRAGGVPAGFKIDSKTGKIYYKGKTESEIIKERDTATKNLLKLIDDWGDDLLTNEKVPPQFREAAQYYQNAVQNYDNELNEIKRYIAGQYGEQYPPQVNPNEIGQEGMAPVETSISPDEATFYNNTLPNASDELKRRIWGSTVGNFDSKLRRMDELLEKFNIKDPQEKASVQLATFGNDKRAFDNLVGHLERRYKLPNSGKPDEDKVREKLIEIFDNLEQGVPITKEIFSSKPKPTTGTAEGWEQIRR